MHARELAFCDRGAQGLEGGLVHVQRDVPLILGFVLPVRAVETMLLSSLVTYVPREGVPSPLSARRGSTSSQAAHPGHFPPRRTGDDGV